MRRSRRPTWRNWAGNQVATPARFARPGSEAEIVGEIRLAAGERRRVKVIGAGHSFTDIACTDGTLLSLDDHVGVRSIDLASRQVTVDAGIRLYDLCSQLAPHGLALPNLGDITRQSIAGATATGTHGTGRRFQSISAAITGFRLVLASGEVVECSADQNTEIWQVGRVGLGALGVVSTITLQCVDAFNLHAIEEATDVDEVIGRLDELIDANDHFEFFWLPHTSRALTKRNRRTDEPVTDRSRWKRFKAAEIDENLAFGAINRLGRWRPPLVPRLARLVAGEGGRREYISSSHDVFATPRRVHFLEMEYAIGRSDLVEAFGRVRELVDRLSAPVSFPIEVRVLGADDTTLGTATGRESAYVAVHVYRGTPYDAYFTGVERIMDDYGGRPHWGKLHFQTAERLAPRYPEWDRFTAVRRELDPDGRFANAYLDRVLGPPR